MLGRRASDGGGRWPISVLRSDGGGLGGGTGVRVGVEVDECLSETCLVPGQASGGGRLSGEHAAAAMEGKQGERRLWPSAKSCFLRWGARG